MPKDKRKLLPPWTPFQRMTSLISRDGTTIPLPGGGFDYAFRNSRYLVLVRRINFEGFGEGLHLSIKRVDQNPIHDWRDLQRIKNEVLGPEKEAIELYPSNERLVDAANQYHLWHFFDFPFNFGFTNRDVADVHGGIGVGAKQRPWDPDTLDNFGGLSTGPHRYYK